MRALQPGAGVWAPAIRAHAGTFYIFVPLPDEGIYVLTAPHPEGPWSAPRLLIAGRGLIDPCPFWDDDGQAYLVHAYARSRAGIKDRLRLRPMAPDASRLLGEGEIVFNDPARHPTLEGPKMYKRNGWYYILAPAGGVVNGWQVALRSRHIYGPYEDRIVLAQGHTTVNGPHQGALVDTPGGQWWFVHFQDAGVYGRVVHLNPVTWRDDWPMIGTSASDGAPGEPVLRHAKPDLPRQPIANPQTSDEMDPRARRPALAAVAVAREPRRRLVRSARAARLAAPARAAAGCRRAAGRRRRICCCKSSRRHRSPPRPWSSSTRQRCPLTAGLAVVGETSAALVVERDGATAAARVVLRIDDRIAYAAPIASGPVRLRVTFGEWRPLHLRLRRRRRAGAADRSAGSRRAPDAGSAPRSGSSRRRRRRDRHGRQPRAVRRLRLLPLLGAGAARRLRRPLARRPDYCAGDDGSSTMNVAPAPSSLSTRTSPSCARTISRTIHRPRPMPPKLRVDDARSKRSKIRC